MKTNKLFRFCMMVAVVVIVFGAYATRSYGQETSTTDDAVAPVNPVVPYVNAGKGYKIGGNIVLTEPGGSSLQNIALGYQALINNTSGGGNTATGYQALYSNTTGSENTANGRLALSGNTTGIGNTASGSQALHSNTTGGTNTAIGIGALYSNDSGSNNTASGFIALENNITGRANTASGFKALYWNVTGHNNIAIGADAGINVTESDNIEIGSPGGPNDSRTIRIGAGRAQTSAYIAGIAGVTLPTANEPLVCIDLPTGQLGTLNCATSGAPSALQEVINQKQQVQIETLQRQNEELQQRMSRLEALIAKK
jgi:hypothetical protein